MSDSKAVAAKAWIEVDFDPPPSYQLLFDGIHAHEELGKPFLFDIDLSSGKLHGDVGTLIGTSCTIWLSQSKDSAEDRYFNGVVTRMVSLGLSGGAYRYRAELRPWFWLLTRVTDCLIFQEKSAFEIITKVFRDAGFSDFKDERRGSAGNTKLDYCVQYRESTYDFVMRLMEQFGLYYFFEHEKGKHTLVISDDPNSHTALPKTIKFAFDQTEVRTVEDHIWEWHTDLSLESGKFTFRDYNFTTPSADLTAKSLKVATHAHGDFEVYEYPGPYDLAADGQGLTDVRIQAIIKDRTAVTGTSNARALHAGWRFKLSHHPEPATNREYLITGSEFSIALAEGSSTVDGETVDTYRVNMRAIPGDVHFRLPRLTPRPLIRGPQTAVVVGPSGEEIYTDKYGRVKVSFHWDRIGKSDENSSCWVRVAQTSAGVGWGSMFIPRIGQEVVVEFLEGNPDRPLITGVVYNANVTVPYPLPDNATRSTIKSNSSKGGGGFNELRFEDKKDSEEVFFQAQKDYNKVVLNNETVKIHKDTTTTVETGNRKVTVSQGNDDHTVTQGNRSVTVSQGNNEHKVSLGNDTTTVSAGNYKVAVSAGTAEISAAQSLTIKVGGNSLKIDTTSMTLTVGANTFKMDPSGLAMNGTMIKATASAAMQLQSGAPMTLQASMISLN